MSLAAEQELVRMQFGSHVYGTNLPTSDLDYKAVFLPSIADTILQRATSRSRSTGPENAKNAPGDVDVEEFSLQGYLRLLCEGQTVAVDMLFVPERFYVEEPSILWARVREQRHNFLSSGVAAFIGYCRQQANKYGVKGSRMAAARDVLELLRPLGCDRLEDHWPAIASWAVGREHVEIIELRHPDNHDAIELHLSVCGRKAPARLRVHDAVAMYERLWERYGERARQAMDNEGIDWKALMHAVRVLREAEELLATGAVTFPRPERERLLEIRQGRVPYAAVAEEIESGMAGLPSLVSTSVLRAEPDRSAADMLILEAYGYAST